MPPDALHLDLQGLGHGSYSFDNSLIVAGATTGLPRSKSDSSLKMCESTGTSQRMLTVLSAGLTKSIDECTTLESLHETAVTLVCKLPPQPVAYAALATAVTKVCCKILRRGWDTIETAENATLLVSGFQKYALLTSFRDVQLNMGIALVGLCKASSILQQRRSSPIGMTTASTSSRAAPAVDDCLQLWIRHAQLFAKLAENGHILRDDAVVVERLLEVELQHCLFGATFQELSSAAGPMNVGGALILRATMAAQAISGGARLGTRSVNPNGMPQAVSALAFDALHSTDVVEGGGLSPSSPSRKRVCLAFEDAGLVDPACQKYAGAKSMSHLRLPTLGGDITSPGPCSPVPSPRGTGEWMAARQVIPAEDILKAGLLKTRKARQEIRREKSLPDLPRDWCRGASTRIPLPTISPATAYVSETWLPDKYWNGGRIKHG